MYDPSQPPLIEETLLKSRRSLDELAHRRSLTVLSQVKRKRVVRGEDIKIKRPEQFLKDFRIREGGQRKVERRKREVERRRRAKVPEGSIKETVGVVVRVHEARHSSIAIKKELRRMGLNAKYDVVFMKLDEDCISKRSYIFFLTFLIILFAEKLKPYDGYVAYGYVPNKTVIELVHRRAYIKDKTGTRVPLSDNITVENTLGHLGILCLNDLSHEIYTVGPHFKEATGVLSTFQLSAPLGHYEKKVLKMNDEMETKGGFLGDQMEDFLNKIL